MIRMMLDEVAVAGMNAEFGRRQREDQPAFACVTEGNPSTLRKKARSASGSRL
jgi:hypothetical protein